MMNKDMTTKEKAGYVWDYYKLHITAIAALLIFIFSVAHSQLTKPQYVFDFTYMGSNLEDSEVNNFEDQLTNLVVNSTDKRKRTLVEILPINNANDISSGMNPQLIQKLFAQIASGDIDIIVLDKTNFDALVNSGAFAKLDEIKELGIEKEASGSGVYYVDVQNNEVLKKAGFDTENKVMCMVASSKRVHQSVLAFKWILSGIK